MVVDLLYRYSNEAEIASLDIIIFMMISNWKNPGLHGLCKIFEGYKD